MCVAAGRLKIVSPLRASLSLQHVGTMVRCQDTSPSSVLTRRHEEQRLIIYKQTPVHHVWLGTSPALNVTVYEAIHFIAYSIQALWKICCINPCIFSHTEFYIKGQHFSLFIELFYILITSCNGAQIPIKKKKKSFKRHDGSLTVSELSQLFCKLGSPVSSRQPSPLCHPIFMGSICS